ncbi:Cna B-type domain-containing protein [Weissella coleopterorum]|uniref:Cna B-type domain-containing protein n=1 Tax=Weissella coleopterorum TaxID=2714949 RepID=A0A6G8AYC1_9LACO|nr:Cna B-type domain-containing protein [Weissella coleopterorum]QIL50054.1 Cna B-type domain-containing protein [Weissella coleopterorum]
MKTDQNGKIEVPQVKPGSYTLKEIKAPENYLINPKIFEIQIETGKTATVTIHGTPKPAITTIKGVVKWFDKRDLKHYRPVQIKLNLMQNGQFLKNTEVGPTNQWKYRFNGLPEFDAQGKKYKYTLECPEVEKYIHQSKDFDVTYRLTGKTNVQGQSIWQDQNNQAEFRPPFVEIELLRNSKKIQKSQISASTHWHYEFDNLEQYNSHGREYIYDVVSSPVKHYISQKSGYNFTNSFKPNFTKVMGHKIWEDDNDVEGLRPKNIAVGLLKNGQIIGKKLVTNYKNWHYEFDQLEQLDDQGRLIQYQIIEDSVANYEKQVQGYDLKNTLLPNQTKIQGTKVWRDDDNKDQTRPKKIVVELIKDGTVLATQTVDAKSGWNYEFKNIPKYQHGRKIQYQVREQSVKDYQTSYEGDQIIGALMGEIQITGRHSWKDQENKARVRPEKIVVYLTQNGKETQTRIIDANNDWHYIFENLPKYDQNGKKYLYNVSVQKVPQYVTHSDGYDFMGSLKPRFIFKEKKDKTKFDKVKPENQKPVVSKVEESKVKVVDVVTPKQAVVETTKQQSGAENTDKNDMTEDKTETSVKEKTPVDFKNKTSESTKVKSEAPKQETLKVEEPKVKTVRSKIPKQVVVETNKDHPVAENAANGKKSETAVKVETPVVPKAKEIKAKVIDVAMPKQAVVETTKQKPVAKNTDQSTATDVKLETTVKVETPVDLKNAKAEPTKVKSETLKVEEPKVKVVDPKTPKPVVLETTKQEPVAETVDKSTTNEKKVEIAVKVETPVDLKNEALESDQAKIDVNKTEASKTAAPKIEEHKVKAADSKTPKPEVVETIKQEPVAENVDKSTTNDSKLKTAVKVESSVDLKNKTSESDQAKVDVNKTEASKTAAPKIEEPKVKVADPKTSKSGVVEATKNQSSAENVATETEVETAVKVETPVDLKNAKSEPTQVKPEASKTAVPKVEEPEVKAVDSKTPKPVVLETTKQQPVAKHTDQSTVTDGKIATSVKEKTSVDLKNKTSESDQAKVYVNKTEASKTAVTKIEEP